MTFDNAIIDIDVYEKNESRTMYEEIRSFNPTRGVIKDETRKHIDRK